MQIRVCQRIVAGFVCWAWAWAAFAAPPAVTELKEAVPGLSGEMAGAVNSIGYRVTGASGVVCDIWFVKQVPVKPGFKPSDRVKYPFQQGELLGVIRYPQEGQPTDFRGQELKPGVYTLRYGMQPDDGNHLGTSEIRDFVVGSRPADDKSPGRIDDIKKVFKMSSGASGSTHPAIFLLNPPPAKSPGAPRARHDADRDLLILEASVPGDEGGTAMPVPVEIVVSGKTDA
ncbi:MAG: hypothetical protein ACT4QC_15505 [Planctomycetaceae bacterium]